jgi:hypothetical protein
MTRPLSSQNHAWLFQQADTPTAWVRSADLKSLYRACTKRGIESGHKKAIKQRASKAYLAFTAPKSPRVVKNFAALHPRAVWLQIESQGGGF